MSSANREYTDRTCLHGKSVYIESDRANARQPEKSLIFWHALRTKTHSIIHLSDNKKEFLLNQKFILLPYFLYSCKHRKYLKGCKGALYQPACDQQIHPEAGGKRWLQTFSRSSRGVVLTDEGNCSMSMSVRRLKP